MCKIQLAFGKRNPLTPDECRRKCKEWLLLGLHIPRDDPAGRERHMAIKARDVEPAATEDAMDEDVDGLVALAEGR